MWRIEITFISENMSDTDHFVDDIMVHILGLGTGILQYHENYALDYEMIS